MAKKLLTAEELFVERARKLAERRFRGPNSDETAARAQVRRYLVFRAAGGLYGIDLREVRGVMFPDGWVQVPGAPSEVWGIVPSQGEVHTVLSIVPSGAASAETIPSYVVLLKREGYRIGIGVDEVEGIEDEAPGSGKSETSAWVELLRSGTLARFRSDRLFESPLFHGKGDLR